jgi:hypothetical protein
MSVWWISLWIILGSCLLLVLAGILAFWQHKRREYFWRQRFEPIDDEPNSRPKNGRILLEEETTIGRESWDHPTIKNNAVLTIVEYAPQKRSINVNGEWHTLQFPYIVFVLVKRKRTLRNPARVYTFVGFTKKPVTGDDTKVWFPPLPHVYDQYNICLGCTPSSNDIAIEKFWNTSFHDASFEDWTEGNNRVSYHGTRLCYKHFGGFEKWSELGLRKVKKKLCWGPAPYKRFLERCLGSLMHGEGLY